MSQTKMTADTVVIGAGIIGISVAYYLARDHGINDVIIVDPRDPMSHTSAQSGENYRNWWPHPVMTSFTDHSIDLMEKIARETDNRINMTRRGYALVTRQSRPEQLLDELFAGYAEHPQQSIRVHEKGGSGYIPPKSKDWEAAPTGVDVLFDPGLIRNTFPSFSDDVGAVLHVRRAGSISGQQLGQFMLDAIRPKGGRLLRASLVAVERSSPFELRLEGQQGTTMLRAERLINAAGPSFAQVNAMLGEDIPVSCVFQQKIAFEDRNGAVPRDMPFTIDLDRQRLEWNDEDRDLLSDDPIGAKLLDEMPGGIHCRPDGAEDGRWIKLGWAYNEQESDPLAPDPIDPHFPDTVLRGASRLNPKLASYIGRLPRGAHHYGGHYVMTRENWPIIGPMTTKGAFAAGALSGFGTMAACSTGSICAGWVAGGALPRYARALSLARYQDAELMAQIEASSSRGVL